MAGLRMAAVKIGQAIARTFEDPQPVQLPWQHLPKRTEGPDTALECAGMGGSGKIDEKVLQSSL